MFHSGQLGRLYLILGYLHSGLVGLCNIGSIREGTSELGISAFWC